MRYSPDGSKIAAAFDSGSNIKILDGSTYNELLAVNANVGNVYSVEFSSDSKFLLACGSDRKFEVLNVSNNYNVVGGGFDVGQIIRTCRFASDDSVGIGLDNGTV